MKYNYNTIFAFLIYTLCVGALVLSDLIIVASFSKNAVSDWAFYKSLIFVFGGLCVFGYDQVLLRSIEFYDNLKIQFILQSIFLSSLISLVLYFYFLNMVFSFLCFLIIFMYSFFLFESGYWRAKNNLLVSQINTNLWKLIIFIFISIIVLLKKEGNILYLYFSSFLVSFFIIVFINYSLRFKKNNESKILNRKDKFYLFYLGLYFFIHNFSLVVANYGEQFIINISGNRDLSYAIFSYITIYSSIVLAVIGFLGFYLGPKVRLDLNFNKNKYYKYYFFTFFIGLVTISINSLLVWFAYDYFLKNMKFDIILWSLIIILTLCRVLYVLPSLCLGVLGSEESLKKSAIYTIVLALVYIGFFFLLMYLKISYITYFVVGIMIVHWLFKIFISNYYVRQSFLKSFQRVIK